MALIKCTECGNEISDKASACPHCGAPVIHSEHSAPTVNSQSPVPIVTLKGSIQLERVHSNCTEWKVSLFIDDRRICTMLDEDATQYTVDYGVHKVELCISDKICYSNNIVINDSCRAATIAYRVMYDREAYIEVCGGNKYSMSAGQSSRRTVSERSSNAGGNDVVLQPKWVTVKLIFGILSMVLCSIVMLQSCTVNFGDSILNNGETGGAFGILVALNLLASGIVAVVARKSVNPAPMIVSTALCWLNYFYAKVFAGSYSDLVVWGFVSFVFGVVYLFSGVRTKKGYIIAGAASAVYLIIALLLLDTSAIPSGGATGTSGYSSSIATTVVTPNTVTTTTTEESSNGTTNVSEESGIGTSVVTDNQPVNSDASWEIGNAIVKTWVSSIGTNRVMIAVPIKNTGNVNLFLHTTRMDLEDSTGHLIDSFSTVSAYPQIIQPGETAWYYETASLNDAPNGELSVVPHPDVEKANVEFIRLPVSDVTFTDDKYGGIEVTGRVENTTSEEQTEVYVVVNLYDASGNFVDKMFTIVDSIAAGDTMGFSISSFGYYPSMSDISTYEIYAFPFQYQF